MSEPWSEPFQAAVAALRRGDHELALNKLDQLPPLPPALEARAWGLRGQCLLALGQPDRAKDAVLSAMRLARSLGDDKGLLELRALNGEVYAALAQQAEQERLRQAEQEIAALPLEQLLEQASTPEDRAMALVRKASHTPPDQALDLAQAAVRASQEDGVSVRAQVLALLALARAQPDQAMPTLLQAQELADEADELNLLTAIAQAARAIGAPLPPKVFGS